MTTLAELGHVSKSLISRLEGYNPEPEPKPRRRGAAARAQAKADKARRARGPVGALPVGPIGQAQQRAAAAAAGTRGGTTAIGPDNPAKSVANRRRPAIGSMRQGLSNLNPGGRKQFDRGAVDRTGQEFRTHYRALGPGSAPAPAPAPNPQLGQRGVTPPKGNPHFVHKPTMSPVGTKWAKGRLGLAGGALTALGGGGLFAATHRKKVEKMDEMSELAYLGEVSKGIPSAWKVAGKAPRQLQSFERMRAHELGRAGLKGEGKMMRVQSRTGSTGERGFGKPVPGWKKPETTADRLRATRGY